MKKLMVMLAAVAMAVGAQASSVYWTCTNVKDATGTAIDGIAYFMVETATQTQAQFIEAIAGKGADAATAALGSAYSFGPSEAGKYTVTSADAVDVTALGLADDKTYNAYLVIFDNADLSKANFYVTSVKELTTMTGTETSQVKWGSQSTPSQAAGAWTAVAVPEPTSGLLMLVGLAGLALRRRRA